MIISTSGTNHLIYVMMERNREGGRIGRCSGEPGTGKPSTWTISELPDHNELGQILQSGNSFLVLAGKDRVLACCGFRRMSDMERPLLADCVEKLGVEADRDR
jgi:hypothetical protein